MKKKICRILAGLKVSKGSTKPLKLLLSTARIPALEKSVFFRKYLPK